MRVLFISRAYPPVVGGIENQNEAIGRWLSTIAGCEIIANGKGKKWLPVFIPWAVAKGLWSARNADVILLGDGVVAIIAWWMRILYPHKRIVCILHGLDITYQGSLYQMLWVKLFFRAIDHFIAVSQSTANVAMSAAIKKEQITVIPNGIDMPAKKVSVSKDELSTLLSMDVSERHVLLTVGRLVKRKGVVWFLRNVLLALPENYLYVIAGDGPEQAEITTILQSPDYAGRVVYLGVITEEQKCLLFSTADLFIQPNIEVPGDVEGFGITVIEAGGYGLPVLASDLEGLRDSVQEGYNGWRVPVGDKSRFVDEIQNKINEIKNDKDYSQRIIQYVNDTFSYEIIIKRYQQILEADC